MNSYYQCSYLFISNIPQSFSSPPATQELEHRYKEYRLWLQTQSDENPHMTLRKLRHLFIQHGCKNVRMGPQPPPNTRPNPPPRSPSANATTSPPHNPSTKPPLLTPHSAGSLLCGKRASEVIPGATGSFSDLIE